MGSICDSCSGSNKTKKDAKAEQKARSSIIQSKTVKALHVAINETCLPNTTFQCTVVSTKSTNQNSKIATTKNIEFKDLYNAGDRISDVTKLRSNDEFYALIRRFEKDKNLDETQIQKYKITKTDTENQINIEFIENCMDGLFKNNSVNTEGIEVIESDDKLLGFLLCNDYFANPPNSNLYYLNMQGDVKLIHSLDDDGYAEWNGIVEYQGYDKNGYLILPQFLNLGRKSIFSERNIRKFQKWSTSNGGEAIMYFVRKEDILQVIESDDHDEKKEIELKLEKVYVSLNDNYKSQKSLFVKYNTTCHNEGFEAISIDDNNNVLLIVEYSNKVRTNTFDCIVTGQMVKNNDKYKGHLELIIDPTQYVIVDNNGGGNNHGQEALIYVK